MLKRRQNTTRSDRLRLKRLAQRRGGGSVSDDGRVIFQAIAPTRLAAQEAAEQARAELKNEFAAVH